MVYAGPLTDKDDDAEECEAVSMISCMSITASRQATATDEAMKFLETTIHNG